MIKNILYKNLNNIFRIYYAFYRARRSDYNWLTLRQQLQLYIMYVPILLLLLCLDRWIINGNTNFAFYIIFIYSNSPPTIYSNDIHLCAFIKRSTIYVSCVCVCVFNGILSISMMIITRFAYNISNSSSAAEMWCGGLCMQHTKSAKAWRRRV